MAASVTYTTVNGQILHENRGGTERFYVPDPLGNTAALVDTAGNVTDNWTYWPYGEIVNHGDGHGGTGTSASPFTFSGTLGVYADEAASAYARTREYDLPGAQWISVDRFWPSFRAFSYCGGSPHQFADPTGLAPGCSSNTGDVPCEQRTRIYCDQAQMYGLKNRALNCICAVSGFICNVGIEGNLGGSHLTHQQRSWFDCMNRCIFKHFSGNDTPAFRYARRLCDELGWDSPDCENALIHAEQDAFSRCESVCKSLTGMTGKNLPYPLPGFPFPLGGSYEDRVGAAQKLCLTLGWGNPDDQVPPYPGGIIR